MALISIGNEKYHKVSEAYHEINDAKISIESIH